MLLVGNIQLIPNKPVYCFKYVLPIYFRNFRDDYKRMQKENEIMRQDYNKTIQVN